MKEFRKNTVMIMIFMFSIVACKDESPAPAGGGGENKNQPVEGTYAGTWESTNDMINSPSLKEKYEKLVLVIGEDDSYEWTWFGKDGKDLVFKGTTTHDKTSFKHSSGSAIWTYSIWVNTLNGESAPGGWDGIYTYEGANTLVINVEPRVSGWPSFPTPEGGIGSGAEGMNSVYKFNRK